MKTNLYINYYVDKVPIRQSEFIQAMKKNLNNSFIDRVYILCEGNPEISINSSKAIIIKNIGRLSYFGFINVINHKTGIQDINIITNLDIHFDDTISHAKNSLQYGCLWALTRNDMLKPLWHNNCNGSQDTWIFKGRLKNSEDYKINLGVPGCDNAIAERFHRNGLNVTNPSLSVKSYHVHKTQIRNYTRKQTVKKPYKLLKPCNL